MKMILNDETENNNEDNQQTITKNGNIKSLKLSLAPFNVFWIKQVAFLKGSIFIKVIIPLSKPSIGNHIPDNTDCPAMIIEDTPPIDFSVHIEPRSNPTPIKNKEVTKLNKIANSILTDKIDASKIIPIKKNKIDCMTTIGIIAIAYENINSYDLALDT